MNLITCLLVTNCIVSAVLVWNQYSLKSMQRKLGQFIMGLSKDVQHKVEENTESTISELQAVNKKLDTLGRVLTLFEDETKILQKRREEIQKIQSRFQPKRELR